MKNIRTLAACAALATLAACGNTNSNDASYAADTTNKNNIAARDSAKDKVTNADIKKKELATDASEFLVKSFESGMYEIELAQLAETKAGSATIKEFANQLVTAHKGFNSQIQTIAFNADFKLPGGIDSDHAKELAELDKQKGIDFDKKFMDIIVKGHENSVDAYTNASEKLGASETKDYATATLPKIKTHLEMAKKIKDTLK